MTCPDLDDNWFKISYPATGLEGVGLFDVSALELNPNTEGEISLEFRPPIDTLAGSYSPTIRLLSENNPDLTLLDLIYIDLPTNYQVGIELHTILGKVGHKDAVYELVLNNQGNLIRELYFQAKTRDEEEICTYKFNPTELKLLPNTTEKVSLLVKPSPWWRRPLFGQPLPINFEANIIDKQSYPLANASAQGTLSWKARSWWQFLLFILLGLGLFAGLAYMIWRLLHPDPLKIESFGPDKPTIIEGDEVSLNWKIVNFNRMQKLAVVIKQPPNNDIGLNFDKNNINKLIKPDKNNPNPPCNVTRQEELICRRVGTGIKKPGKYVFELKTSYLKNSAFFNRRVETADANRTAEEVEVMQKQIAEVVEFKAGKREYKKGDNVSLNWKIKRPELVLDVKIDTRSSDNVLVSSKTLLFKDGNIADPKYQKACIAGKQDQQFLDCKIDDLIANQVGIFSYQITVRTNGVDRSSTKPADSKIEVLPKPFQIVSFKINNIDNSKQDTIILNEGDQVTVSWKVEGENVSVNLSLTGDVAQTGATSRIPVDLNFPRQIKLKVTDKFGKRDTQERGFFITVKPKPTPTPDLVTPAPSPTQNIFPFPASPRPKPLF